mgnify:CR=1 FL=1
MKISTKEEFLDFMSPIEDSRSNFGTFVFDTTYRVCNYIFNYMYNGTEFIVLGNGFREFKTEVEAGIYIGKNTNSWCALKVINSESGIYVSRVW